MKPNKLAVIHEEIPSMQKGYTDFFKEVARIGGMEVGWFVPGENPFDYLDKVCSDARLVIVDGNSFFQMRDGERSLMSKLNVHPLARSMCKKYMDEKRAYITSGLSGFVDCDELPREDAALSDLSHWQIGELFNLDEIMSLPELAIPLRLQKNKSGWEVGGYRLFSSLHPLVFYLHEMKNGFGDMVQNLLNIGYDWAFPCPVWNENGYGEEPQKLIGVLQRFEKAWFGK